MSDIFVSYTNDDIACAEMLALALQSYGWSVFWDRTIPAGELWREVIGRELKQARCVVALWSKAAIGSAWVQDEAEYGRRQGTLVPILIENVEPPYGFQSIQTARLVNWDGNDGSPAFKRLVEDVTARIGPPPLKYETADQEDLAWAERTYQAGLNHFFRYHFREKLGHSATDVRAGGRARSSRRDD